MRLSVLARNQNSASADACNLCRLDLFDLAPMHTARSPLVVSHAVRRRRHGLPSRAVQDEIPTEIFHDLRQYVDRSDA